MPNYFSGLQSLLFALFTSLCFSLTAQPSIRLATSGEFDWTQNDNKETIVKCDDVIYIPLNAVPSQGASSGNFTFNVTYVNSAFSSWQVSGDLKVVTSSPTSITVVSADVQDRGATTLDYSQSKGRINLIYKTEKCEGVCGFDVYKKYNTSYISPISGPTCLAPLRQYTFCVDPLATDNLNQQIGMDRYFWTVPPGCTIDGYSNDSSKITLTTTAGYNGGKLQCCFGLCNQYSSQGVLSASPTCTTMGLGQAIVAPVVTITGGNASPNVLNNYPANVCVGTNAIAPFTTAINFSVTPQSGYSYTWNWPAAWGGTPPFSGSSLSLNINNNPGDVLLTSVSPCGETRTYSITIKRMLTAALFPVPNCTAPNFSFTMPSGIAAALNLPGITAFQPPYTGLPTGWSASYNNYGDVAISNPAVYGNFTLSISNTCTAPFIIPISIRPAAATINAVSCLAPGEVTTVSTTPATGLNYTWTQTGGSGYSCSGCGSNVANSSVNITGGTGGSTINLQQTVTGSSPACATALTSTSIAQGVSTPGLPNLSCTALTQPSNITASVTPSSGATAYSWSVSPGSLGSLGGLVTTTPSQIFSANGNAGTITITCSASNGNCVSAPVSGVFNLGLTPAPFNLTGPTYIPVNPPDPAYAELDVTGTGPGNQNGGTNTTNYIWYNCSSGSGYGAGSVLPNNAYRTNPTNGNSSWLLPLAAPGVNTVYGVQMSKNGCVYRQCVTVNGYQNMITPIDGSASLFDNETAIPKVTLSPNVSNGHFMLWIENTAANGVVKVIGSNGKIIKVQSLHSGENNMECTDMENGVYELRIEIGEYRCVKKLVVAE
ncbi:MAG: hypothetical protein U0T73_02210 [Chitinophagales bacterium]